MKGKKKGRISLTILFVCQLPKKGQMISESAGAGNDRLMGAGGAADLRPVKPDPFRPVIKPSISGKRIKIQVT